MKRGVGIYFLLLAFWQAVACADMIEVKKDGIMNGKVVSENKEELQFKDAKGNTRTYKKEDVLYLEKEEEKPLAEKIKQQATQALREAKKVPEKIKETSDGLTKQLAGGLSAPLDRGAADAKSDALSSAMDEASRATVALSKKNMAINQEIKEQTDYLNGTSGSSGSGSDSKKGRFESL